MTATHRSKLRRTRPGLAIGASALGLASMLVLTSCSKAPETGAPPPASAGRGGGGRGAGGGPVTVMTAAVVERSMPVMLRAVGNVEASSTVEVRAQVTGELLTVNFEEGQEVKAGEVLFTIDPRSLEVSLKQAEAVLARDTGQSKNAETQRARYTNLQKNGLASQAELDAISAQANALQSAIAADNAQIENIKLQLSHTKILAPVSGRTGALLVHKGSIIRANDASPLVVINQISPVSVGFAVPARLVSQIRAQQARSRMRVQAVVAGAGDAASAGFVNFIDNSVDSSSDTIRLKASFPNTDRRLWPGQFVEVLLELSVDPRALVIPSPAVQPSQRGPFVFVVKADKTVESRPIKVARTEGADTIVQEGLQPGEQVVTDGQLGLTSGARVTIKAPSTGAKQGS
jgi:multidrug efflux system membrane fusion protein